MRTVHLDGCVEVEAAYTARRRLDRPARSTCSGMICTSGCSIRRPASCCASICARRAAGIASHDADRPRARRRRRCALLAARDRAGPQSAPSAPHPRPRRRRRCPPHPRRARARQTARAGGRRRRGQGGARARRPTYRFLRRYLERRPPVPLTLRQVDPLIRQLTLYRDLIDRTTGDPQ